jgi:hypothetical protein
LACVAEHAVSAFGWRPRPLHYYAA